MGLIAVDKGQVPLRNAMNSALTKVENSGQYNKLLYKWFHKVKGFDFKGAER